MSKNLYEKYTIEIYYGSDFQKEIGSKMINALLLAFEVQQKIRHKKNKTIIKKIIK